MSQLQQQNFYHVDPESFTMALLTYLCLGQDGYFFHETAPPNSHCSFTLLLLMWGAVH